MTIPADSPQELDSARRSSAGATPPRAEPPTTVYNAVRETLITRGWSQGCATHHPSGALCLRAAIDDVVGANVRSGATGAVLGRAARMERHLRELAPTSNLDHWNDAQERSLSDVMELLALAAAVFPDD